MRFLYNCIIYLTLPIAFARLWWRGKKTPAYRKRWAERLGFVKPIPPHGLFIHAVSLGETIAATELIQTIQKRRPDLPITITNMTPSGSAQVQKIFGDQVTNVFLPYDTPGAVKRFLNRVKPIAVMIIETELWPNLLRACKQRNIPILLANARLSERSANGYRRLGALTQQMMENLTLVAAQNKTDGARFIQLGLAADKLIITGSIKFDITLPQSLIEQGHSLRQQLGGTKRPVWIAASTHIGEEQIILEAFKIIRKTLPDCALILVPRHSDRFASVANLCEKAGFQISRHSEKNSASITTDIYLGDTFGEMFLFYAAADIAFVGGSFVPVGGHNVIEPAALALPIITGPHLHNFSLISQTLETAGALKQVQTAEQLAEEALLLWQNPKLRHDRGQAANSVVAENQGALKKHVEILEQLRGC